ncbi:Uncharacterised protein [Klebsiella pneumoniae]|nr:Uncharacterised protein [Klebsiella pneumoniae]
MPEQRKIFAVPRTVRVLAFKTTLKLSLQRADTTRTQNDVFVFEYWFQNRVFCQWLRGWWDSAGCVVTIFFRCRLNQYPPSPEHRHEISTWAKKNNAHAWGNLRG